MRSNSGGATCKNRIMKTKPAEGTSETRNGPTKLNPLPETEKATKGITRKAFGDLLKRAITPHAAKPAPKSI